MIQILGLSGSLRSGSTNTRLLQAAALLAPEGVELTLYGGMGELPHFNPDLDTALAPPAVPELRRVIGNADALLISSPEYAHGVPGSLKNLLDWLVSSTEFPGMPVALVSAGAGEGEHAQAQLQEILKTMSAPVLRHAGFFGADVRRALGANGRITDERVAGELRDCLEALREAARNRGRERGRHG